MIDPAITGLIQLVAMGLQQQIDLQGYYPPVEEIAAFMVTFALTQSAQVLQTTLNQTADERFEYVLQLWAQRDSLLGT